MGIKEITIQKALLNTSNKRYKKNVEDYHDTNFKMKQVGFWLDYHSSKIEEEIQIDANKTIRRGFISFKRGTLIRVDFGVNIGSEISGRHFAIVLNRRDSEFNPTLTVVPLTSKDKPRYINIGMEVYDQISQSMQIEQTKIKNHLEDIQNALDVLNRVDYKSVEGHDDLAIIELKMDDIKLIHRIANIEFDESIYLSETSIHNRLGYDKKLSSSFIDEASRMTETLQKLNTIYNSYMKYKKNTFADVTSIQTISKNRIVSRINEFDPMGVAIVSKEVISSIKNGIKEII